MLIGQIEQTTKFRFRSVDDFETYISAIDIDYDSEVLILTGWLDELNTPQSNKVNRSNYGIGTDLKHDIIEFIGNNCYIPTIQLCFVKCFKFSTNRDSTEEFLNFIRDSKRTYNVINSASIQPFCKNVISTWAVLM